MLKTRLSLTARSTPSVTCSDSTRQTQVGKKLLLEIVAIMPIYSDTISLTCRTTSSKLGQLK